MFFNRKVTLLPGSPLRVSRPNWFEYIMSIDINKPMNLLELKMLVNTLESQTKSKVCLKVYSDNGETEMIGEETKEGLVLELKHKLDPNGNKTGHFLPIVEQDGKLVEIEGLTNLGAACGPEAVLFLFKYKELLKGGVAHDDACKQAKDYVNNKPNVREDFLENVRNNALDSAEMRSQYYGRSHEESSIIGGRIM
jgi:hypothetical protein